MVTCHCGVQGQSPGRGSGYEPGRRYGEQSPPKADDIFRLKGIFLRKNTSIITYFNKVGLLIFPFWTPHFVIWTPHFGWTPCVNYTVLALQTLDLHGKNII